MIVPGTVSEIMWDEGNWIFLDIGFSGALNARGRTRLPSSDGFLQIPLQIHAAADGSAAVHRNDEPQALLAGAFLQSLSISNVELERQRGHGSGRGRRQDLTY
jgi:hypothetical protein